ncbi:MAG: alpha/beta hydrolase [Nanoarchaeota archaeon]
MKKDYFESLDKTKIYYEFDFEGKTSKPIVTFIHGQSGGSLNMLKSQIEYLGKKYSTLAFDLRGGGFSDLADNKKDFFSLEKLSDDLIGLLEHEKIDKTHLVGYSLGSAIALKTFEKKPKAIESLVLLNPTYNPLKTTSSLNKFIVKTGISSFFEYSISYTTMFVNTLRGVKEKTHFDYTSKKQGRVAGYIDFNFLKTKTPEELKSRLKLIKQRLKWDVEDVLDKINIPLLCIGASEDIWTLPSAAIEIASRANGRYKIIVGNTHESVYANPEEINKEIIEFIDSIEERIMKLESEKNQNIEKLL